MSLRLVKRPPGRPSPQVASVAASCPLLALRPLPAPAPGPCCAASRATRRDATRRRAAAAAAAAVAAAGGRGVTIDVGAARPMRGAARDVDAGPHAATGRAAHHWHAAEDGWMDVVDARRSCAASVTVSSRDLAGRT
eukprot:scaffold3032_cov375-Prasinococcus_capsulatus_cf.AAC.9